MPTSIDLIDYERNLEIINNLVEQGRQKIEDARCHADLHNMPFKVSIVIENVSHKVKVEQNEDEGGIFGISDNKWNSSSSDY